MRKLFDLSVWYMPIRALLGLTGSYWIIGYESPGLTEIYKALVLTETYITTMWAAFAVTSLEILRLYRYL